MKTIKLIYTIVFFILNMLFIACSSSGSVYDDDYELSDKLIYSADMSFAVLMPKGWNELFDNECNCNNILLISPDYKASINIIPIYSDRVTETKIRQNPIPEIAQLIKADKKTKIGESFKIIDEENIKTGLINASAFRYSGLEDLPQRTVILEKQNRYFEVNLILSSAGNNRPNQAKEFYIAQNSLLKSLIVFN